MSYQDIVNRAVIRAASLSETRKNGVKRTTDDRKNASKGFVGQALYIKQKNFIEASNHADIHKKIDAYEQITYLRH